ncbi:nuclear transport factor 2 family protein [Arundinibacter roseus]|uniref:Nuclear transport factor 2 family protein n=1 Tax=Arundinibacter roseus TaxID=2070510 RepID=A0A4R4K808_9BACT|nr:nuclear transport factor 2 family protein [Arundinibacter roseus]TDB63680.1 hypothetical protein EZE20_15390 [Arundinibacter roseus]
MKSYTINLYRAILMSCLLLVSLVVQAQSPETEIRNVIDQLFTGMRTGDSSLVSKSFLADATLQSVSAGQDGSIRIQKDAIQGFIKAVGTPHSSIWDEQIYGVQIKVDGPIAHAWVPYKFFVGTTFSHCGVNSFTMIRMDSGWKIASITDTRRKEPCIEP